MPRPHSPDEPDASVAAPVDAMPSVRSERGVPTEPRSAREKRPLEFAASASEVVGLPHQEMIRRSADFQVHRKISSETKPYSGDSSETPPITPKVTRAVARASEQKEQSGDQTAATKIGPARPAGTEPAFHAQTVQPSPVSNLANAVSSVKPVSARAEINPKADASTSSPLTLSPKGAIDHFRNDAPRSEHLATPHEEIHVVIGRVTVNAIIPPQPSIRAAAPTGPKLSLEQYLKDREGR